MATKKILVFVGISIMTNINMNRVLNFVNGKSLIGRLTAAVGTSTIAGGIHCVGSNGVHLFVSLSFRHLIRQLYVNVLHVSISFDKKIRSKRNKR
jgi:hypothetical protein